MTGFVYLSLVQGFLILKGLINAKAHISCRQGLNQNTFNWDCQVSPIECDVLDIFGYMYIIVSQVS